MKERSYLLLHLGLCFVVAAFCLSCDSGSSDDSSTTVVVTNGAPAATAQQLASGDHAVVSGGPAVALGPYTSPGDGAITAAMTWSEATQITAFFKKSGPDNFGWVNGDSTLNSTADPVAKDETVTLYLVNSGGVDAAVHFTVTYVP